MTMTPAEIRDAAKSLLDQLTEFHDQLRNQYTDERTQHSQQRWVAVEMVNEAEARLRRVHIDYVELAAEEDTTEGTT